MMVMVIFELNIGLNNLNEWYPKASKEEVKKMKSFKKRSSFFYNL